MKINEGATVVHVATPRVEQKILILAHYFVLYIEVNIFIGG